MKNGKGIYRMQLLLVLVLILVAAAVVFALENVTPVVAQFLFWKFEGSLALLLLLAFSAGVVASILASLPSYISRKKMIGEKEKKIKELENTLIEYRDSFNPPEETH